MKVYWLRGCVKNHPSELLAKSSPQWFFLELSSAPPLSRLQWSSNMCYNLDAVPNLGETTHLILYSYVELDDEYIVYGALDIAAAISHAGRVTPRDLRREYPPPPPPPPSATITRDTDEYMFDIPFSKFPPTTTMQEIDLRIRDRLYDDNVGAYYAVRMVSAYCGDAGFEAARKKREQAHYSAKWSVLVDNCGESGVEALISHNKLPVDTVAATRDDIEVYLRRHGTQTLPRTFYRISSWELPYSVLQDFSLHSGGVVHLSYRDLWHWVWWCVENGDRKLMHMAPRNPPEQLETAIELYVNRTPPPSTQHSIEAEIGDIEDFAAPCIQRILQGDMTNHPRQLFLRSAQRAGFSSETIGNVMLEWNNRTRDGRETLDAIRLLSIWLRWWR